MKLTDDYISKQELYKELYNHFHCEDAPNNITDVRLGAVRNFVKNFPSVNMGELKVIDFERKGNVVRRKRMSIDDAIENLEYEINEIKEQPISHDNSVSLKTLDIALRSLKAQKKLAELRGMDICRWSEDYDYDDNNISEYEYEATVDDFLIDEAKEEE